MTATQSFALSRPIKTHSGEIATITLREPTAGVFLDHGEPFALKQKYKDNGEADGIAFEFTAASNKAMTGFLVDMIEEKVDEIILRSLSASDYQRLRLDAASIILMGIGDTNPTQP